MQRIPVPQSQQTNVHVFNSLHVKGSNLSYVNNNCLSQPHSRRLLTKQKGHTTQIKDQFTAKIYIAPFKRFYSRAQMSLDLGLFL